jgi:hypothetical protein
MPMHRRNKAPRVVSRRDEERWFEENRKRSRRRDRLSRQMRQKQRRIAKGKR